MNTTVPSVEVGVVDVTGSYSSRPMAASPRFYTYICTTSALRPTHTPANTPGDYKLHKCDCITDCAPTFSACYNVWLFSRLSDPDSGSPSLWSLSLSPIESSSDRLPSSRSTTSTSSPPLTSSYVASTCSTTFACLSWATPLPGFGLCWLIWSCLFCPHKIHLSRDFVIVLRLPNFLVVPSRFLNSLQWLLVGEGPWQCLVERTERGNCFHFLPIHWQTVNHNQRWWLKFYFRYWWWPKESTVTACWRKAT